MKKTYDLEGMTCGGCVNSAKRALMQVRGVNEAEVQLNPQKAVLTSSEPIDLDLLQAQLKKLGHFTIKEAVENKLI